MNPSELRTGPAVVKWRGQWYHFRQGLTVTFQASHFEIATDRFDSERLDSISATITGIPAGGGQIVAGSAWANALLYPLTKSPGQKLFATGGDEPLEVWELEKFDGTHHHMFLFHRAAVSAPPGFEVRATELAPGSVTWTALLADDGEGGHTLYEQQTDATALPGGVGCLNDADLPAGTPQLFFLKLGAPSVWFECHTLAGIRITHSLATQPIAPDATGLIDYRVTRVGTEAVFQPWEADALAALRAATAAAEIVARGWPLRNLALDIGIRSAGLVAKINKAFISQAAHAYGRASESNPTLTARSTRNYGAGCVEVPPFQLIALGDPIFTDPNGP